MKRNFLPALLELFTVAFAIGSAVASVEYGNFLKVHRPDHVVGPFNLLLPLGRPTYVSALDYAVLLGTGVAFILGVALVNSRYWERKQ
jgi:hypothetical protein